MIQGTGRPRRRALAFSLAIAGLVILYVLLQVVRDDRYAEYRAETTALYIPTGAVLQRVALSFDTLLADVYWIRAIQHYGRTKLSEEERQYDLLYPLLDITTSLDPRFNIAYRFGAIFLGASVPGWIRTPRPGHRFTPEGRPPHAGEVGISTGYRVRLLLVAARLPAGGGMVSPRQRGAGIALVAEVIGGEHAGRGG